MKKTITLLFTLFAFVNMSKAQTVYTQQGLDIDGPSEFDNFGNSVSMPDAKTIAIGIINANINTSIVGKTHVYRFIGGSWVQKGQTLFAEATDDKFAYAVSMPDSNTLAISAIDYLGLGTSRGNVRIFSWNGTIWVQKGLAIIGEADLDHFGTSISMPDSNTIAIGTPFNDGNGSNAGHVRVFHWNGSAWVQDGTDINGDIPGDFFGQSVSMINNNMLAIGATQEGNGGTGYAKIYVYNGSWTQLGNTITGENAADNFGYSISMSDVGTVGIGATKNDGTAPDAGHVRVYSWNGTSWNQKGLDIDGEGPFDQSGHAISMPTADMIVIGSPYNDVNGIESGHVRNFRWNGTAWIQAGNNINSESSNNLFGSAVSCPDEHTIAVGAPLNDEVGIDAGHTRVFSVCYTTYGTTNDVGCFDYTWLANNQVYTASGTYIDTLVNVRGCDSIITLNLVLNNTTSTQTVTACDSYSWLQNLQTYTVSGIYSDTVPNSMNCFHIYVLDLTINQATDSTLIHTVCGPTVINGQFYSASGMYTQSLVNVAGCDSVLTIDLTILPIPTITVDIDNDGVFCENSPITLTASGASSISWDNGISNGVAFIPSLGTTIFTATGTENACSAMIQVPVVVGAKPVIEATASSLSVCEFDSIYFSGNGALQYNYLTSDFTYGGWFKPTQLGNSTYLMEGIGTNGCKDTVSIIITLRDRPLAPSVNVLAGETCYGQELSSAIIASATTGVNEWFYNEDLSSSAIISDTLNVNENSNGVQSYFASNYLNSCYSPPVEVLITFHPLPQLNAGPEVNTLAHETVTISGNLSNAQTSYWTNNIYNNVDSALTFSFMSTTSLEYTLHAISDQGCIDSSKVKVNVNEPFVASNYISANGDGDNDTWKVHPIDRIAGCHVRIFNTFGVVVFESFNYNNTWAGTDLPEGDYYFEIKCDDRKTKGSITLVH